MKKFIRSLVAIATCGMIGNAAYAGDWVKAESEHFVTYSNVGESTTRNNLKQLESFKYIAEMILGSSPQSAASQSKFTVYFLSNPSQFDIPKPGMAGRAVGFYLPCVEGTNAFSSIRDSTSGTTTVGDTVYVGRQKDGNETQQVLQHEFAHHLMFSRLNRLLPVWYVEGFASYMETVSQKAGKFSIGDAPAARIASLTSNVSWIDFATLLKIRNYSDTTKVAQLYGQAWLLTHYMLSDSERTKAFNRYFESLAHGADPVASFESITGIATKNLDGILRNYTKKMGRLSVSVPEVLDSTIVITKLPNEFDDFMLESAALQTCNGAEYGKKLLEKFRTMERKHGDKLDFRLALNRAEIVYGDATKARIDLEKISHETNDNFFAHYLLGRASLAGYDANKDAALLSEAKQELAAAYKLNKLNPPNLYYLAKALNGDNSADSAPSASLLNAATAAAVLMPSVPQYGLFSAEINMRAGNRDQAIRALQPFASDPHNPQFAAGITRVIAALEAGKAFVDAMNAFKAPAEETKQ